MGSGIISSRIYQTLTRKGHGECVPVTATVRQCWLPARRCSQLGCRCHLAEPYPLPGGWVVKFCESDNTSPWRNSQCDRGLHRVAARSPRWTSLSQNVIPTRAWERRRLVGLMGLGFGRPRAASRHSRYTRSYHSRAGQRRARNADRRTHCNRKH